MSVYSRVKEKLSVKSVLGFMLVIVLVMVPVYIFLNNRNGLPF